MNVAKFRQQFSNPPEELNSKLFNVDENRSIQDYVVDYYKEFESENFKLIDYEYVDKPHLIDIPLNKINIKNKKIRDDNEIKKIISIGDSFLGELKLKWRLTGGNKTKVIERSLLIPQYINNELWLEGNKILPIKQIIDTIYSVEHKNKVAIKSFSTLTISKKLQNITKLKLDEDVVSKKNAFKLNVFNKDISPLLMYYPRLGFRRTMKYFKLDEIMEVIPKTSIMLNRDLCHYYNINDNLMLEVSKKMTNKYVEGMTGAVIDSIPKDATYDDIMTTDKTYWYRIIGAIYSASKSGNTILKKGKMISTLSFKLALDGLTKNILDLPEEHKKDSWAMTRYMIFHFDDIVSKRHDIKFKRLRLNEYIALSFIHSRDEIMHAFINSRRKDINAVEKIFRFTPNALIKSIQRKKETAKLIRYNANINDLQAINLLRYSFSGPKGISSKNATASSIDFYPSYLFKLDPNAMSTSSPGVTGLLTPFTYIDDDGYFHDGKKEFSGRVKKFGKKVDELFKDEKIQEHYKLRRKRRDLNFGIYTLTLRKLGGERKLKPFILKPEFDNTFEYVFIDGIDGVYDIVWNKKYLEIEAMYVGDIEYKLRDYFDQ